MEPEILQDFFAEITSKEIIITDFFFVEISCFKLVIFVPKQKLKTFFGDQFFESDFEIMYNTPSPTPGLAKLFDPRADFATAWTLEDREQCDLRNICKNGS